MNRNVVLFVCFYLGVSLLVLHFRLRAGKSAALSRPAAVAAAVLVAALKLPGGEECNEALTAVCSGLAQVDPADAARLICRHPQVYHQAEHACPASSAEQQGISTRSTWGVTWVHEKRI